MSSARRAPSSCTTAPSTTCSSRTATSRDARDAALNVATTGANVVIRNVTPSNSGGAYYPNGKPAGVSIVNSTFN